MAGRAAFLAPLTSDSAAQHTTPFDQDLIQRCGSPPLERWWMCTWRSRSRSTMSASLPAASVPLPAAIPRDWAGLRVSMPSTVCTGSRVHRTTFRRAWSWVRTLPAKRAVGRSTDPFRKRDFGVGQPVLSLGHAGGADGVADQEDPFGPLAPEAKARRRPARRVPRRQ